MKYPKFLFIIVFTFVIVNFWSFSMNKIIAHVKYNDISITDSCTIFTSTFGEKVYFGNNEDYYLEGTYIWFIPSQERYTPSGFKQINGAVYFGYDNNGMPNVDGSPQGGMNDKGLCFDGNGLPPTVINYSSSEYIDPYINPFYEILWEYSTVNETIEWFKTHYLGADLGCQIHFADATGDAVVVSVDANGNLAFTRINNSAYLVSTNFNLANIANGFYPCERYETACAMLSNIINEEELTIDYCRDVLNAVHSEGYYGTKYSNIFDLKNQDIYIYYNQNFGEVAKLNLADELAKIHPEDEDIITGNDVYYKSFSIADIMTMASQSVPISSIVPITCIAGIMIVSIRELFISKNKVKKNKSTKELN